MSQSSSSPLNSIEVIPTDLRRTHVQEVEGDDNGNCNVDVHKVVQVLGDLGGTAGMNGGHPSASQKNQKKKGGTRN